MILEQSLIDPHFIGRDGFRWFIGQIPAGNSVSEGRCKVRIFGYHPGDAQIKDKDLPWAHILVPPSFGSGAGYCGTNINVQPGTYVFGFFIDGDDAQQPVIVGAFYDDPRFFNAKSQDTYNKVLNAGTSSFNPFYGVPPRNSWVTESDTSKGTNSSKRTDVKGSVGVGSTSVSSVGKKKTTNNVIIDVPTSCTSGKKKFNKMQRALIKLIEFLNTLQVINDVYINPALNTIANIGEEVKKVAQIIGDIIIGTMRGIAKRIVDEIYEKLTGFFGTPGIPPAVKLTTRTAVEKVIDGILCAFEKILNRVIKFVFDFLMRIVNDIISFPVCAVESLVGELVGAVSNAIDEAIGPLLSQITSLIGGTIGTVMSYVGQALSIAKSALAFLSCEEISCYEGYDYQANKGWIPNSDPNFQRALGFAKASSISNLTSGISTAASSWLGSVGVGENSSPYGLEGGSCNANVIICGLPNVTIFGGGGSGATASAIVDAASQVMGYLITPQGSGYTDLPFISIDSGGCSDAGGAIGQAVINDSGQVTSIIPIQTGSGYGGQSDYTGSVNYVYIENTGIGYTSGDTITVGDSGAVLTPSLDPSGRIISIRVDDPGSGITQYPEVEINTQSGYGAVLKPVLSFTPVGIASVGVAKTTIVYCSEK
jgi:hypothetical protein